MMPRKRADAPLLALLLLQVFLQIGCRCATAQSCASDFEISIYGSTIRGDGSECFESDTANGIVAGVSAPSNDMLDSLLVWDEDAPCAGDDESYIHYSGRASEFKGMTAGKGDLVHTYRAAFFPNGLPLPAGVTGCYAFTMADSLAAAEHPYSCLEQWKVARFGATCSQTIPAGLVWAWTALALLVLVALMGVTSRRYRTHWDTPAQHESEDAPKEIEATAPAEHKIV